MDGSEAGVDLVLIQTFLLYYVSQVILNMLVSFKDQNRSLSPHLHSKARILSPQL